MGAPCQNIEIGANFGVLTQPWNPVKVNMPVARGGHGSGLVNNKIIVFGGFIEGRTTKSTSAFDTTTLVSIL